MKTLNSSRIIYFFSLITLFLPSASLGQTYTITDLGALGGLFSQGFGVNASGQVTGYFSDSADRENSAFIYSAGTMKNLGDLGGGTSFGYGINSSGQVAGWSNTADFAQHAFLYSAGVMKDLGTLGGRNSVGYGINSSGQVTGWSSYITGLLTPHAFLYSGGTMTDIGTLGGDSSIGRAINTSGQITGSSSTTDIFVAHAFLYSGGKMTDIGSLGGSISAGQGINASGEVTGFSFLPGNIETGSTPVHAFLYRRGKMSDIGTLGGDLSEGLGINASGKIVGSSLIAGNTAQHAFLYDSIIGMVDLNTLLPAKSGWTLFAANAINDAGQITGGGNNPDGVLHAFLLSPVSAADLSIRLGGAKAVKFGGNLHYTLVVQNKGPKAAKNVVVTDTLPRGAIRVVNFPRVCHLKNSNTLICKLGTMLAESGTTIHFMLEDVTFANVGSRFTNRARVSGAVVDPDTANNTSTRSTKIK